MKRTGCHCLPEHDSSLRLAIGDRMRWTLLGALCVAVLLGLAWPSAAWSQQVSFVAPFPVVLDPLDPLEPPIENPADEIQKDVSNYDATYIQSRRATGEQFEGYSADAQSSKLTLGPLTAVGTANTITLGSTAPGSLNHYATIGGVTVSVGIGPFSFGYSDFSSKLSNSIQNVQAQRFTQGATLSLGKLVLGYASGGEAIEVKDPTGATVASGSRPVIVRTARLRFLPASRNYIVFLEGGTIEKGDYLFNGSPSGGSTTSYAGLELVTGYGYLTCKVYDQSRTGRNSFQTTAVSGYLPLDLHWALYYQQSDGSLASGYVIGIAYSQWAKSTDTPSSSHKESYSGHTTSGGSR